MRELKEDQMTSSPRSDHSEPRQTANDHGSGAELLARVEAATGPDRELDALIWLACGLDPVCGAPMSGETREGRFRFREGQPLSLLVAKYPKFIDLAAVACQPSHVTASIDAALALVERALPGANCHGYDKTPHLIEAYVSRNNVKEGRWLHEGRGPTPALAMLAALLRALSVQSSTEPTDIDAEGS